MEPYTYRAYVRSVHDGDTIHADVDLGFGIWKMSESSVPGIIVRFAHCNARELAQPGGKEATENLRGLLPAGTLIVLRTVKADKYGGRYDGVVELNGVDLISKLIDEQWLVAWDGKGTAPLPPWPRTV